MYCSRMPSLLSYFLSFHHVYYHDVELQEICLTFCQITFGSHGKQCGISDIQVGEDLMTLQNERGRWVGELVRLSQNYGGRHQNSYTTLVVTLNLRSEDDPRNFSFQRVDGILGHLVGLIRVSSPILSWNRRSSEALSSALSGQSSRLSSEMLGQESRRPGILVLTSVLEWLSSQSRDKFAY